MTKVFEHLLPAAVLFAGFAFAMPAAAVSTPVGYAFFEDFEGYPLGPGTFSYCNEPEQACLGILSGGNIITATPQFLSTSGTQLYSGTNLVFALPDPFHFSLPALYANITTGNAPVQFDLYRYDYDLDVETIVFSLIVPANTTNQRTGHGSDELPESFTRFHMTSPMQFAIDDLQIGLENVWPGIPEPASWLMMILGFGAVGIRLRRPSRTGRIVQRGPMA